MRRRAETHVDGVRDGDQGKAPADGVDGGARVVEELVPDVAEEEEVAVPETSSASLSVWARSTRATAQERSLEAPPESESRGGRGDAHDGPDVEDPGGRREVRLAASVVGRERAASAGKRARVSQTCAGRGGAAGGDGGLLRREEEYGPVGVAAKQKRKHEDVDDLHAGARGSARRSRVMWGRGGEPGLAVPLQRRRGRSSRASTGQGRSP